jgi:hypothetical protein
VYWENHEGGGDGREKLGFGNFCERQPEEPEPAVVNDRK